jgi:uncharacterized protein YukE
MANSSDRIRVLSDAIHDLDGTMRQGLSTYRTARRIELTDGMADEILQLRDAVREFSAQLSTLNSQLARLANAPIIGLLGGGAETELQKLVRNVDAVNATLRELMNSVHR